MKKKTILIIKEKVISYVILLKKKFNLNLNLKKNVFKNKNQYFFVLFCFFLFT